MNTRLVAARVIDQVVDGHSLSDCLEPALASLRDPRDRAFVQAICYGVCRFYTRFDVILSHLLQKPFNAKDSDVHALLMVGLFQLIEMRVPPHAAVGETVNATEKLKKPWSRGLVNAILREYLRRESTWQDIIAADEEALYAHPAWWINALKTAWPADWQAVLTANNAHPPFTLRVNQQKISREQYLEKLKTSELSAEIIPETKQGIVLATAVPVIMLPGFAEGEVFVQDGAAQLAAELMELAPGLHVLDACAAPGGKLIHMLEIEPTLSVVAVENDPDRLDIIKENLARMQVKADCICDDAGDAAAWWDGRWFDRILLDAPCSASGVVRRHPDIKLLRLPSDIKRMAKEQARLLRALWPLLKPGGLLVYATCSFFPEENMQVVREFIAAYHDANEVPIVADWGVACEVGRQILPGKLDGFYYAKIRKSDAN